ncbi:phage shock envelope stress response protein PspM [Salinispora arenicola]
MPVWGWRTRRGPPVRAGRSCSPPGAGSTCGRWLPSRRRLRWTRRRRRPIRGPGWSRRWSAFRSALACSRRYDGFGPGSSFAGTSAAEPWARLDRAGATFTGLRGRLTGVAEPAVAEATAADRSLRDLAARVADVERAIRLAPPETRRPLQEARVALSGQLDSGVAAYERLVVAAAGYVAENARPDVEHPAAARLTEATDLLHGVASALAELRATDPTVRTS